MAFESDPCAVHAATGELLARGFVREHAEGHLVMAAQSFTGAWLDAGDRAVLEVLSADRGVLSFDAVVETSELGRIVFRSLALREAVQHRASLRVRTDMVLQISSLVVDGQEQVLEPAWPAHVDDISADGVRFRTASRARGRPPGRHHRGAGRPAHRRRARGRPARRGARWGRLRLPHPRGHGARPGRALPLRPRPSAPHARPARRAALTERPGASEPLSPACAPCAEP